MPESDALQHMRGEVAVTDHAYEGPASADIDRGTHCISRPPAPELTDPTHRAQRRRRRDEFWKPLILLRDQNPHLGAHGLEPRMSTDCSELESNERLAADRVGRLRDHSPQRAEAGACTRRKNGEVE